MKDENGNLVLTPKDAYDLAFTLIVLLGGSLGLGLIIGVLIGWRFF